VDPPKQSVAGRSGPHKVAPPAQAALNERISNSTILPAVKRMQSLKAERRDVLSGMVDNGYHETSARIDSSDPDFSLSQEFSSAARTLHHGPELLANTVEIG
jgi:hypothetical protein